MGPEYDQCGRDRHKPVNAGRFGPKTTDLERAQDSFSAVWRQLDFRVQTFQEGLGLTGINLGVLGNKVVLDYSSAIGDTRERAETIQANHMEMCRFIGPEDPNYRKVSGEIASAYDSIAKLDDLETIVSETRNQRQTKIAFGSKLVQNETTMQPLDEEEKRWLRSLRFASFNARVRSVNDPATGTCSWLFDHPLFRDWLEYRNQKTYCGLLRLKGNPGAGKSVLMREVLYRISQTSSTQSQQVAAKWRPSSSTPKEASWSARRQA